MKSDAFRKPGGLFMTGAGFWGVAIFGCAKKAAARINCAGKKKRDCGVQKEVFQVKHFAKQLDKEKYLDQTGAIYNDRSRGH